MAVDRKSIWILTETSARARLDPCRAVHPPADRVRPANTERSILRPTRPHAQCGMPITQENKLPARLHDRPPTRVRPRFECKRTKRAIARALRPPATHQENVIGRHRQTERPSARSTHCTGRCTNPRENAAKYSAHCSSSRTILLQPSRPNAMLSRRCATALVSANWWDSGRLEHLVRRQRGVN